MYIIYLVYMYHHIYIYIYIYLYLWHTIYIGKQNLQVPGTLKICVHLLKK